LREIKGTGLIERPYRGIPEGSRAVENLGIDGPEPDSRDGKLMAVRNMGRPILAGHAGAVSALLHPRFYLRLIVT
jgi:hypothetical protein